MLRSCGLLVALLAIAAWANAFDDPPKSDTTPQKPVASLKERIEKYQQEMNDKQSTLVTKYRDAKTDDDRSKVLNELQEMQQAANKFFMDAVRQDPKNPDALAVLQQALMSSNDPKQRQEIVDIVSKYHIGTQGVGDLAVIFAFVAPDDSEKLAREVSKQNAHRDDKGKALLALGMALRSKLSQGNIAGDPEKVLAEAKEVLQSVQEKYADVQSTLGDGTLGDLAKRQLSGLDNVLRLAVGKEVPDLAGQDLDGAPFKLSDYRGKVVLLDFWAHW